jgi:threonine dehydratase
MHLDTELGIEDIELASKRISEIAIHTSLDYSERLSRKYGANIYLKREDQQAVRSYKIRGAYNLISSLSEEQRKQGIVTASAGNHAQGVAFCAKKLKIRSIIFMPKDTQLQKINRVKTMGGEFIEIRLVGENFDECSSVAYDFCVQTNAVFIPPFDDPLVIAGQGTVAKEIYEDMDGKLDVVICPVGGGGLIAGVSTYFSSMDSEIEVIGVEPEGADAMNQALKNNRVVTLDTIDTFVDGAAVKRVGEATFNVVQRLVNRISVVPVGKICCAMVDLYQEEGIVTEPAGVMSVACLDMLAESIKSKTVICIISGGNNDLMRYPEIIQRANEYTIMHPEEFTQKN